MGSLLRMVAAALAFTGAGAQLLYGANMQVHEALTIVPTGYTLASAAPSETILQLRIALVQNNIDGLIDALYDVSDPDSANYGLYLSKDEVSSSSLLFVVVPTNTHHA